MELVNPLLLDRLPRRPEMATFPMAYKRWTSDMDKELIALLSSSMPSMAIALMMGRSELAICQRIMLLHNRGELVMLPSGSI